MSIPVSSTTLTITRLESLTDANSEQDLDSETDYVPANVTTVTIASNLRANINSPTGQQTFAQGGERTRVVYKFQTDPIGNDTILSDDILIDALNQSYTVSWCRGRAALGVSWLEGECYQEIGAL